MSWIELHQSVRDHRKVLALADQLAMPEPHVVGHMTYLWLWALDNAPDGTLPANERIIERAAAWMGEAGAFVTALEAAGMLERDDTGQLHIHDWHDYAGKLIDRRRADVERKKNARADVQRMSAGCPADVQRMSAATVPYRTLPYRTLPTGDPTVDISSKGLPKGVRAQAPKPPAPAPVKRENPIWDALCAARGVMPATPSEKSDCGKTVRELNQATATPEEVHERVARMLAHNNPEFVTWSFIRREWSAYATERHEGQHDHEHPHTANTPATASSRRNRPTYAAANKHRGMEVEAIIPTQADLDEYDRLHQWRRDHVPGFAQYDDETRAAIAAEDDRARQQQHATAASASAGTQAG